MKVLTVASRKGEKAQVLVGFFSTTGKTDTFSAAVAAGARTIPDVIVTRKNVTDITKADLESAHGVILGCPTHYANIPAAMKTALDPLLEKK